MTSRRLQSIDVLRGVAILLVLAIHIPHHAPGGWREHPFFLPAFLADFGYFGVPLFIVISGFCIHRAAAITFSASGSYRFDWIKFWKRRFVRLYPPYLFAIVLSVACAFYWHDRFPDPQKLLGWDLVTHLLLIHNLTAEFGAGLGNGAFWSLGTEEQLYALYFVLLLLLSSRSPRRAIVVASAVTIGWRLLAPHLPEVGWSVGPFHIGRWFQWPLYYWLHWALGAIAVDAYLGNTRLPSWCRSLALAAGLLIVGIVLNKNSFELLLDTKLALEVLRSASDASLQSIHNMGELVALVGFFCLLNWTVQYEGRGQLGGKMAALVAKIGTFSYSIYLVHVPIIYILEQHLPIGFDPAGWVLRYLVYGAIALVGGYLFHQAIERWFLSGKLPSLGLRRDAIVEQSR